MSDMDDLRPEALIWCEAFWWNEWDAEREKRHEPRE